MNPPRRCLLTSHFLAPDAVRRRAVRPVKWAARSGERLPLAQDRTTPSLRSSPNHHGLHMAIIINVMTAPDPSHHPW